MRCHVPFHAAIGRKHHVTVTADVLLHTGMSSDVSLQYTARHKRLQTFDAKIWLLTYTRSSAITRQLAHQLSILY